MNNIIFKILLLSFIFCMKISAQSLQNDTVLTTDVCFYVNTNKIVNNDPGYDFYKSYMIPFLKSHYNDLYKIEFNGSASPEGSISINNHLAKIRSEALLKNLNISKDKIYITSQGENYERLLELIKNNEQKKIVKDIILSGINVKERIQALNFYSELLQNVYPQLRSLRVKMYFCKPNEILVKSDTVYIHEIVRDILTLYIPRNDTIYIDREVYPKKNYCDDKILFSVYNDLVSDLIKRKNLGIEWYFWKSSSLFIEGSFSDGNIFSKTYNIDIWHTGYRKYFNNNYNKWFIEGYGRIGYFDTDIFWTNGKYGILFGGGIGIGYKIDLKHNWKLYPIIRIGFDCLKYNNFYYYKDTNNGNINISFDQYIDGKKSNVEQQRISNIVQDMTIDRNIIYNSKSIDKAFLNNCKNGYWFGPTYIGLTLQKDFKIKIRNKNK